MMIRIIRSFIVLVAVPLVIVFSGVCFLTLTSWGGGIVSAQLLKNYLQADGFSYQKAEGSIFSGVTLYNTEATNARKWKWLPGGTGAKAKRVDLSLTSFNFIDGLNIKIDGGEIFVKGVKKSDITGTFSERIWRLFLSNVKCEEMLGIPHGVEISAEMFSVIINTKIKGSLELDVQKGKVLSSSGNSAAFEGTYSPGKANFYLSSEKIEIADIKDIFFRDKDLPEEITAEVKNIRMDLTSEGTHAGFTGSFTMSKIFYKGTGVADLPAEFLIAIKRTPETFEATGNITTKKGVLDISGEKIDVEKSDISFRVHKGANEFAPRISAKIEGLSSKSLSFLPPGSVAKIKKVNISVDPRDIKKMTADIFSGTVKMPLSDPMIFSGTYNAGEMDIDTYSKKLSVSELVYFHKKGNVYLKNIAGLLKDVDLHIGGTLDGPRVSGTVDIQELSRDDAKVYGTNAGIDITMKRDRKDAKVYGEILFQKGEVFVKNIPMKVLTGEIKFNGAPGKFLYDFKGTTNADEVKINIHAWGNVEKPKIELTSAPPLPEDRLLFMLLTGKSWKDTEISAKEGKIAEGLSKDTMEYLFSSGEGGGIAKQFGIKDISFQYDESKRGIKQGVNVKNSVSDNVDITYGVGQRKDENDVIATKYTVGSEYKINENVSVGAEKEIDQENFSKDKSKNGIEDEKKVYVKIKQDF